MPPPQVIESALPLISGVSDRERLRRCLRIGLLVALCAVLMFGPLAFGVVDDWSTALFESGAAAVLCIWVASQIAAREVRVQWNPLFAPMLAFLAIVLLQILFHRYIYLYDCLSELWLYLAYGVLLFVAVQLQAPHNGFAFIPTFSKVMGLFGALYALFAVFQGLTSAGHIYWRAQSQTGSVYGAYVNHNHYAGLMELLLPLVLVLAFGVSAGGARRILLASAAMLMATSVFLSQSRGGMFAIVVEIFFLSVFWIRQFSPGKSATLFVSFSLLTALFLAWIAPHEVGARIADIHDPARWLIHRDSMRMFAAHPVLGSGLGNFPDAFPHYRVFYDGFFVNHAHDDYLELLLECGLAGLSVAVWFVVILYRRGFRNLRAATLSPSAMLSTAALAACTGLLAHSFVDFNLHLPSNAAVFYVLCAIATASPATVGRSLSNATNS